MNITKVELLWSRACPLRCAGCAMPQDHPVDSGTIEQWLKGVENMRAMGSQFVAIYGAEPLKRMYGLPEVITKIYEVGMKCTLITAIPTHPDMNRLLDSCPLDSLTVSWDGIAPDAARQAKGNSGQIALPKHPNLKDRACVATVTDKNADMISVMARQAHDAGYWFLFDIFHSGNGPYSKCNDDSRMAPPSVTQVRDMCAQLLELKDAGLKIHCSREYLIALGAGYNGNPRDFWHCKGSVTGWLTCDANGDIFGCDDWQVAYPNGKIWDTLDFEDVSAWKQEVIKPCIGCSWNTHWDAVKIEEGVIDIGSYIHY